MSNILVTGSAGLVGSEAVRYYCGKGRRVVGIDNDLRKHFFGENASTDWNRHALEEAYGHLYDHRGIDIRGAGDVDRLFAEHAGAIDLVIHAAAQPSHDWAVRDPRMDFGVNASGTLNLLEAARQHTPDAVFIFCSTNKVYGDRPNALPLVEQEDRWEIDPGHEYWPGVSETMSIDQSKHSLFGASKVAADVLVQEYGRYFGMRTTVFRGGCLTGPAHSGAKLHGFLSYLAKCTMTGEPYQVFGYQGKQVRDNIHSHDLIAAFDQVYSKPPTPGSVFNIGGGREANCSMREAIKTCEDVAGKKLNHTYVEDNRIGDHIWWISDLAKFKTTYPDWKLTYTIRDIIEEIVSLNADRWSG